MMCHPFRAYKAGAHLTGFSRQGTCGKFKKKTHDKKELKLFRGKTKQLACPRIKSILVVMRREERLELEKVRASVIDASSMLFISVIYKSKKAE